MFYMSSTLWFKGIVSQGEFYLGTLNPVSSFYLRADGFLIF
jgi:hypothetical protein